MSVHVCVLCVCAEGSPFSRDSLGSSGASGKHFLHLQSPLKTYYLYAETEEDLNRWLDALALPWLGYVDTSPEPTAGPCAEGDSSAIAGGTELRPALHEEGLEAEEEPVDLPGGGVAGAGLAAGSVAGVAGVSVTRPGRLDTRVSLSARNLEQ
jgi:hypothetical protein